MKNYRYDELFAKVMKEGEVKLPFEEGKAKAQIADIVRSARIRAKLTQSELAKLADTTQAVISRIESGADSRIPTLGLLAKIAEACKAKLTYGFRFKS